MTSLNPVMTVGDQIAEVILIHQSVEKSVTKAQSVTKAKEMLGRAYWPKRSGAGGLLSKIVSMAASISGVIFSTTSIAFKLSSS